jgi:two-component system chemotaxis response regulator CheY
MKARILVVDDSVVIQRLMEMNLRRLGEIELVTAEDGMEGLRFLVEEQFDLALVDINMPVMDGLTMLKLYCEDAAEPQVPLVMVTTEGEPGVTEKAMSLGAAGYISKPIDSHVLRELAVELIEKYRAERREKAG